MTDRQSLAQKESSSVEKDVQELGTSLDGLGTRVDESIAGLALRIGELEVCAASWKNRAVGASWVVGGIASVVVFLWD